MTESSRVGTPQGAYISLVTFRRDGREVATPVWFAEAGGRLYAYTLAHSGKLLRLAHTSRVRVAECTFSGDVIGPWLDGTAAVINHPGVIATAMARIGRKYGWRYRLATWMSWMGGNLKRRRVIEIELNLA